LAGAEVGALVGLVVLAALTDDVWTREKTRAAGLIAIESSLEAGCERGERSWWSWWFWWAAVVVVMAVLLLLVEEEEDDEERQELVEPVGCLLALSARENAPIVVTRECLFRHLIGSNPPVRVPWKCR
jgi:hypothetical protein